MSRGWLLVSGSLILFLMGLLDQLAYRYYWYWRFPWFDGIMHFLGGAAISIFVLFICFQSEKLLAQNWTITRTLAVSVATSLIISLGWELFESAIGNTLDFRWGDKVGDTASALIGSLVSGLCVTRFFNNPVSLIVKEPTDSILKS